MNFLDERMIFIKIVGLITEYNPFHNGHLYHLKNAKEITNSNYSIAVMSGNFVQRGEPAFMDKWTRAKLAVLSGVDLVIELPTIFSISSADYFAFASCSLLNDLNIIDNLVFGSEYGDIKDFNIISDILVNYEDELNKNIEIYLKQGFSYPISREKALKEILNKKNLSLSINHNMPNNILGIEYIKNLKKLNSNIQLSTIQRINSNYNDSKLLRNYSSATSIRNEISKGNINIIKSNVPNNVFEEIKLYNNFSNIEQYSDLILLAIRRMNIEELREIHDVTEGLEYKILKEANSTDNVLDLINNIKSKRYTKTRIQRILFKILLNIKKDYIGKSSSLKPNYIRILAFNENGKKIISKLKKHSNLPIITNLKKLDYYDSAVSEMLKYDIRATNIYSINSKLKLNSDFYNKPNYIK